jgi:hypothetical protein
MKEQFPYFHSVRETALRDFKHCLYAPKEISFLQELKRFKQFSSEEETKEESFDNRFLKSSESDEYLLGIDQLRQTAEEKVFNGQKYISRYHYNTEIDIEKLAIVLNYTQYFREDEVEDNFDMAYTREEIKTLSESEERRKGRVKYKIKRIEEELGKILNGNKSVPRELFIVGMLLSGYKDINTVENALKPEGNGFEELNVTRKFDAMVYEATVQTKDDTTPLAAFLRLCENVLLCEHNAFKT